MLLYRARCYFDFLNYPFEACGNFIKDGDFLIHDPDSVIFGKTTGKYIQCQHKFYSSYIYHTHPLISNPYPSPQDILKLLKNKKIILSIIFTKWGIWSLYCPFYFEQFQDLSIYELEIAELRDKISLELYFESKKKSSNLRKQAINNFIKNVEYRYKTLQIKFIDWKNIKNGDSILVI